MAAVSTLRLISS